MTELDAAIARRFPEEWRRANDPAKRNRSKARNNLRRRYRAAMEFDDFVLANPRAKCGNCANLLRNPGSLTGTYCDLDSDFHGYMRASEDGLCVRWIPARSPVSDNGEGL